MNGTIDTHDDVHCMGRRGSHCSPPTPGCLGPGPESRRRRMRSLPPSSSSVTRRRHLAAGCGGSYEEAVRGMREAEDDSPAYAMVCLPIKESGALPPYEVIPGDTAPYEREDQTSESGGLSRILNLESQESTRNDYDV